MPEGTSLQDGVDRWIYVATHILLRFVLTAPTQDRLTHRTKGVAVNDTTFNAADLRTSRRPKRRRGDYTIGKHNLPICADTGKVRYRDHTQARDGLGSAKWKGRLDAHEGIETKRHETRAYKCPECNGWHTTSITTWTKPPTRPATELPAAQIHVDRSEPKAA